MPRTSRLGINLAFAIALLVLLAGGLLSYRNVRLLLDQQSLVVRAETVLREIGEIGSYLKDAETSQRGYVITQNERFLAPYNAVAPLLDDRLAELRLLMTDAMQRENMDHLELLARHRMAVIDTILNIARAGDFAAAEALIENGPGTAIMDSTRARLRTMEAREFALLQARRAEEVNLAQRTIGIILIASLLAITMIALSRQGMVNELHARELAEHALEDQQSAIHRLYDIAASHELGFEEKVQAFLTMGTERLNVSTGVLARIHNDLYEVVAVVDAEDGMHPGDVFPLGQTYCATVVRDLELKAWEHASQQGLGLAPCFEAFRLETYIGVPVIVNGELYGAFCFSDEKARETPFSESEKDFLSLTSQWIAGEISRQQSERALREGEQRYRRLAEASLESLVLTQEGRIIDANTAYCEMVGLTHEEIIGRDPLTFIAPESIPGVRLAVSTGTLDPYEVVGMREDGSRYFLEARGQATTFQGRPARITAIRDITQRRMAEQAMRESEERYRSLVEAASDIIYRTDTSGAFTYVNPTAVQIMGYSREELIGMPYTQLVREDLRATVEAFYLDQRTRAIPTTYYEFPAITADGREVWIGQNVRFLHEGNEVIGVQAVARDISRQREIERMKDEFLSVVSHELRTPLTAIRGSLGLLVSGKMGKLEERGQRMLEIAAQNTDRLVRLINDLLDFEKIEAGNATMERRPVNIADIVHRAAETMAPMAEKAGVRLVVEAPPVTVSVDPDRLDQVWANLISNAIKFSPEGGAIRIGGATYEKEVVLWIRDEGRGVPADKLELIFERFQQVDSSDARQKGGTGLGLPIARSIVQQHGGRLWAESRWGEGSTFFIALPLPIAAGDAPSDARVALVCDDDEGVGAYVEVVLRREGYTVVRAASGEAGVRLARERRPAVILLDLGLPGMSGREVVKLLKRDPATESIPVVMLTGAADENDPELASVVGWLEKPIDYADLTRTVDWATTRKHEHYHVMLVEDNDDLARVIREMLEGRGFRVCHARTGRETIEMSRRLTFELLLLDPGLPDIDGFGLIEWLRRHDRHRELPVLVYSARDYADAERAMLRLGRTEFLVKTRFTLDELARRITLMMSAAENGAKPDSHNA